MKWFSGIVPKWTEKKLRGTETNQDQIGWVNKEKDFLNIYNTFRADSRNVCVLLGRVVYRLPTSLCFLTLFIVSVEYLTEMSYREIIDIQSSLDCNMACMSCIYALRSPRLVTLTEKEATPSLLVLHSICQFLIRPNIIHKHSITLSQVKVKRRCPPVKKNLPTRMVSTLN